jgi:uncharacterized protein
MDSGLYAIPVLDYVLIYSPLRDLSALVNLSAARELKRKALGPGLDGSDATQGRSAAVGSLWEEISGTPAREPARPQGTIQPDFLGILPTRRCNGACHYCGFGALQAPEESLDLRDAVAAVDWIAEQARGQGRDRLEIHFFGGEPLIAADVIDTVVHRARWRARQLGLIPHFELATNGVCDRSRGRWLGDHFDAVVLSLDGPEEAHDRHRPLAGGAGSFQAAAETATVLSESAASLCLRCCVSQLNVGQMPAIAQWFLDSFQPSAVNFQTVEATEVSRRFGIVAPEPRLFARNYLIAERILKEHGVEAVYAAISPDGPRWTACPVGRDTAIVSPDGRISGCYQLRESWEARGLDLDIGRIQSGAVRIDQAAVDRLRRLVEEKPRCRDCFCRWQCAGGCHVDVTYPGCSTERTPFCHQTRLILTCRLLQSLGRADLVEALWADHAAVDAITTSVSDRIEDWPAPAPRAGPRGDAGGEPAPRDGRLSETPSAPCPSARTPGGAPPAGAAERGPKGQAPAVSDAFASSRSWRASDSITWTVETDAVALVDWASGRSIRLLGPEAALWDLISRGLRRDRLVEILSAVSLEDVDSTIRWTESRVDEWIAQGWLEPQPSGTEGQSHG